MLPSRGVRLATTWAVMAAAAGTARADARDAFGFAKAPAEAQQIDCTDGLDFGCAEATDPLHAQTTPYALATWLPASYLLSLPTGASTHDQVASYVTGVGTDGAGLSIAGANGLENRWTVEGAPADNIQTGGADTRVPLTFLDGILVQTGGFGARDRTSTGGTIDARLKTGGDHLEVDVRAWGAWTATPHGTPPIPDTYQLRTGSVAPGPSATASIVASGPLPAIDGARAWWVAGLAPTVSSQDLSLTASSLIDDGTGDPVGFPGVVALRPIESSTSRAIDYSVPVMLRAGTDGAHQHVALTALATLSDGQNYTYQATPQAGAIDQTNLVGDVIATYRGEWQDTTVRAQVAWHRNQSWQSARDPAAENIPQVLSSYIPATLADDPKLAAACADGTPTDPFPNFTQCPISSGWFASGGAGELVNTTADRPSATLDVAHRFANHTLRAGATTEYSQLSTYSSFTGGEQDRTLFAGENDVRRFVSQTQACSTDILVPCPYVDVSALTYRTLYAAAYVEDTWKAAPNIQVDGGVREELMWVGTALHFDNEIAPRLGASWDPLGGGRSRIWFSMGRSFALLPAGVGSAVLVRDRYADELTYNGTTTRTVDTGAAQLVIDGTQPITQDEAQVGAEVALNRLLRVTTYLQGRWLRYGLDSTASGFGNPGELSGAPATRETRLFALEVSTALDAASTFRFGWAYGLTGGNWTGAYNPREGAALYQGADFDVTSLNQDGPLPTSPGQRLYVEASRRGHLGPVALQAATRLWLQSGTPRDAVADSDVGIIYLIPRGEAGYLPMTTQVDLRLGASWRGFEVTLDLFNLFDRRTATNEDTVYASDDLRPIEGGTYQDLIFLRTESGTLPLRLPTYSVPTQYQAPFSAVLGVHRSF